ncbi:MAG TPA: hypothetical protein EYN91_21785 [Candidatus Melainabacteria bacterium]|jgi:predicted anti-sigma-YlaC factor YlaD|nr:hypothetical protein [Candidatus Melainabacteria bacterium]HIN66773.1 hypothetical protein [Candidatus Obscuribacterales bacterium]
MSNLDCNKARDILSSSLPREATDASVDTHLKACTSCSAWSTQMREIETVAASMPQFDVSEALTQNILKAVESEPAQLGSSYWQSVAIWVLCSVATGFMAFETAENAQGLAAWAIGLGIVYGVYLLVGSSKEVETA